MNNCINFLLDENPIRVERDSSTNRVLSESYDSDESTDSSLDASQCEQQFVRSAHIVHQLKLVATRVDNAIAGNDSLRQFGDAIIKYKDLFLENMEMSLTNAIKKSRQDVERVVSIAENHWLVTPNRLERWIGFKMAELVMFEWMTQVEGVTFLANENQLKEELASLGDEFAIVLFIPSLDEWSSQITEELKNVDPFTTPSQLPMEDPAPWHLNNERRKSIVDRFMELALFQMSNPLERLKCYIAFQDGHNFGGHFTIYKGGKIVKSNLKDLPDTFPMQPTTSSDPKISSPNIRQEKVLHRLKLPVGEFVTNCNNCSMSCARYKKGEKKTFPAYCSVCPGQCSSEQHSPNSSVHKWWQSA